MVKFSGRVGRELTLYVRMLAWLNAVPKPPEGAKRAEKANQADKLSRLERMKRGGISPQMPPSPIPHIIGRLIEMGLTEAAGMGVAPLSWPTIDAWQRVTGVTLSAWEARLLRSLSVAYITEGRRAEDEDCPPPWRAEVSPQERDASEARLRMVLG